MTVTNGDPISDRRRRLRIRELSRYYCATSFPTTKVQSETQPPIQRDLPNQAHLTSLAQLAAFRLGAERSFISVIDDQTQFILAEATRSVSIYDPLSYNPGDGPVVGPRVVPLTEGVCPQTLDAFLGASIDLHGPHNVADKNYILITDLLEEELTRNRPLIANLPPVLRYYLDVPLRTESGHVLGSICVVDSVPRIPGPTDVAKLEEVARLVVEHLEYTRLRQDYVRAQRLLEGLSHFVQGQSSLSTWSTQTEGQETIPEACPPPTAVSLEALSLNAANAEAQIPLQTDPMMLDPVVSSFDSVESATKTTKSRPVTSVSSTPTSIELVATPAITNHQDDDVLTEVLPASNMIPSFLPTDSSTQIQKAFSRASNLIRESMDLEATCFLELPQNDRYQRSRATRNNQRCDSLSGSQSPEDSGFLTDSSIDVISTNGNMKESQSRQETTSSYCYRLGFSTNAKSSVASSNVTQRFLNIPASLLGRLARRFPEGNIFHFDAAGHISSSGDESGKSQPSNRRRRKRDAVNELFSFFPTARSMIFFPLYDNDRQQVYATFLGWTANQARALQPNEIVYVSAFSNSIMCEVMRLTAIALDKAKSNFISSISHELRSPLHGILASCQLLSEYEQYPHQAEFIQMVDTCAHTLLDTMDHVLDYAKINRFTEQQKKHPLGPFAGGGKRSASENETYSLVSQIDLKSIVEDTVSSMAASNSHLLVHHRRSKSNRGDSAFVPKPDLNEDDPSVLIVLTIQPSTTWVFNSEPGSWRRIVMNLVGNSLKYTRHGHVTVDMRCREYEDKKTKRNYMVELKVTDTGQGISQEYLRHRLYTPFSQENNLSIGSGLGLSMVKQIVSSLGGQMQVHSEVGAGTEIMVNIPVAATNETTTKNTNNKQLAPFRGRSICFAGFDDHPPLSEPATGVLSHSAKALLAMKNSIAETAIQWMGMKVVFSEPDVYVIEETYLDAHLEEYDRYSNNLLVVGLNGWRSDTTDRIGHANHHFILPSIGPKRMEEALSMMFDKRATNSNPADGLHTQQKQQPTKDETDDLDNGKLDSEEPGVDHLHAQPITPTFTAADGSSKTSHQTHNVAWNDDSSRIQHDNTNAPTNTSDIETTTLNPGDSKSSVIIVDDNDINLRILATCLKRLKCVHWISAANGKEALEKYQAAIGSGQTIPIIFMDISMPVMDGIESTRRIRAFEKKVDSARGCRTKIVALTGLGSAEAQKDIDASGFDMYLRKPVNLNVIREILTDSGLYTP